VLDLEERTGQSLGAPMYSARREQQTRALDAVAPRCVAEL
jgi:hypothetical protein